MAGAQRVHIEAREREARTGRVRYLGVSICGRYSAPSDPGSLFLRKRMTSAVTCKHCRDRWTKHRAALPPVAEGRAA